MGINGLNVSYNGSAYRITLKQLKNLVGKNPGSIKIKNEPIKRFQVIGKAIKLNSSSSEAIISYDDVSIKARIMKLPIKNQSKEIGSIDDSQGVLIFLTYGTSKGVVDNFILEGIFKINDIVSYEKTFQLEMNTMEMANRLSIFNLRGERFLNIASGFIDSTEYEVEEVENINDNGTLV
uniref:Transferred entry: 5.6.2.2 n=1 Tax=Strongyloides venezuelensis TaxID=75913 RepID=A0A0K0FWC9_STRVS